MAKAETEGHDHEVTTEKVDGKQQVVLVKGCARCEEIRKARLKAEEEARKAREAEEKKAAKEREDKLRERLGLIRKRDEAQREHTQITDRYKGSPRQISGPDWQRLTALDRLISTLNSQIAKIDGELGS